jgi:hypothetical protein
MWDEANSPHSVKPIWQRGPITGKPGEKKNLPTGFIRHFQEQSLA